MEAVYALCPLEPIIPHGLWAIKALGASCAVTILYEAVEALEKIDPDKLDEGAIVRLITEGAKLERSNRLEEAGIAPATPFGLPQKTVEDSGGLDWSKISNADLKKLARLEDDDDEK
jgi:hypothetical protein